MRWMMLLVLLGCHTGQTDVLAPVQVRCEQGEVYGQYGVRWTGSVEEYAAIYATAYDPRSGAAWAGTPQPTDVEWLWTVGPPCGMGHVSVGGILAAETGE